MDYEDRLSRLRDLIGQNGAEAFITEKPIDIRYFTGHTDPRGILIIRQANASLLYVPAAAAEQAYQTAQGVEVHSVPINLPLNHEIVQHFPYRGKILFGELSSQTRRELSRLEPAVFEEQNGLTTSIQRKKSEAELNSLKKAISIAEIGVQTAIQTLRPGVSELEAASQSIFAMMSAGAEQMWSSAMVISGPRSLFPDARTDRRIVKAGEMGFIDVGPLYEGYAGDLTRPFVVGKVSPEQSRQLELTRNAQKLALSKVRAGVEASDLYQAVVEFFDKYGMAGYFPHALGHGLGLLGACIPFLVPTSRDILIYGDVITIEPGLYVPGIGGCRFEDVVMVTEDGFEPLSSLNIPVEVYDHL